MNALKIVSVDLFLTLVDISTRKYSIWQAFLGEAYTAERAEQYWRLGNRVLFDYIEEHLTKNTRFESVQSMFQACYTDIFARIDLDFNPEEAAGILSREHALSTPFPDARPFLQAVGTRYPICLSSDTDDAMLGSFPRLHAFDRIFTSEQLQAYKYDPENRFFSAIIRAYGIDPEHMMHIGDSPADVIGAHRVGITTCWLNRDRRQWTHTIQPDYEVASLIEAASILGVDIDGMAKATD